jgi:phosphoserine phosphatase
MKSLPKIIFFDMEGTIFKKNNDLDNGKVAPSAWTTLAKEISEECYKEEELTKDKWLRGDYKGYLDWMLETVSIHKKHGLTESILNKIVNQAEFHNGAEELFHFLKKNNVITVLISGGFKALADKAQRKLKIDHSFSACEYFFDEKGELEFFNLIPSDNEGKVCFMNLVASEHGISPKDCLFVGDGKNDIFLAKNVGASIAFNAQSELEEVADCSIRQARGSENLLRILDELL